MTELYRRLKSLASFHLLIFLVLMLMGCQEENHPGMSHAAAPESVLEEAESDDRPILGELPEMPEEEFLPEPAGVAVETYLDELDAVWGIEFAPDGRMFFTERTGGVRVVSAEGELDPTPWAEPDIISDTRERGLFDLAFHPDFPEEPWLYVRYTLEKEGEVVNRLSRFREVDGRGTDEEIIVDDLLAARNHNGGRILFGPDGMLYVTAGDAGQREVAQDLDNAAGSILRITPEGAIPQDNPWADNPIWAYGFRNTHGLAFRPTDNVLFAADHGPTGEWREPRIGAFDEVNIVRAGDNHGWPLVVGAVNDPDIQNPLLAWIPAVPPGDLIFYNADLMPEFRGDLFLSTLRSEALIRIRFEDGNDPERVTSIDRWFTTDVFGEFEESVYGRLRGMTVGPDGAIYVGTSNRDGRGDVREGDDRILRISPAGG